MTQEEQRIYYEKALADAIGEYKHVSCLVDAIRMCVTDIDFEEKFPVSHERYLLVEKMKTSEGVQTNLRNSIRFYRAMLKANKPEPWEENNTTRTVNTPCGPVKLVNQDKVSKEELDKMMFQTQHDPNFDDVDPEQKAQAMAMHHCGQDADEHQPEGFTYKELLGMEVICYGGKSMKCCGCSWNCGNCVKVELVGGDYICLAKPERPNVISFDEEEGNVMDDIKEKAEDFLNYLEGIVKTEEQ